MNRSPELRNWSRSPGGWGLVSRVYAGFTNKERTRIRRDSRRNTRLEDWTVLPQGRAFRRDWLAGLVSEEFGHLSREVKLVGRSVSRLAPAYKGNERVAPRLAELAEQEQEVRVTLSLAARGWQVGRTHRPCGLCGALVSASNGCPHWKPQLTGLGRGPRVRTAPAV
jgi:hypothetical protein